VRVLRAVRGEKDKERWHDIVEYKTVGGLGRDCAVHNSLDHIPDRRYCITPKEGQSMRMRKVNLYAYNRQS